jgi:hypothetical protein
MINTNMALISQYLVLLLKCGRGDAFKVSIPSTMHGASIVVIIKADFLNGQ